MHIAIRWRQRSASHDPSRKFLDGRRLDRPRHRKVPATFRTGAGTVPETGSFGYENGSIPGVSSVTTPFQLNTNNGVPTNRNWSNSETFCANVGDGEQCGTLTASAVISTNTQAQTFVIDVDLDFVYEYELEETQTLGLLGTYEFSFLGSGSWTNSGGVVLTGTYSADETGDYDATYELISTSSSSNSNSQTSVTSTLASSLTYSFTQGDTNGSFSANGSTTSVVPILPEPNSAPIQLATITRIATRRHRLKVWRPKSTDSLIKATTAI